MIHEKVSVIMPVYNAEKYLRDSISSVTNQTYDDWKLYIVDDGSTDGSAKIIDKYVNENEKINAIHCKNCGVSVARNRGLDVVEGDFVIFMDADDVLTPEAIAERVSLIKDADIGITNYDIVGDEQKERLYSSDSSWEKEKLLANILCGTDYGYQGYLWNKIFRKDIIDEFGIRFSEKIYYNEDRLFCYLYSLHCNKAHISNKITYIYRKSSDSAMYRFWNFEDKDYDVFMSEFYAYDEMESATYDKKELLALIAEDEMISGIIRKKQIKKNAKRIQKKLSKIIRENGIKLFKYKKMNTYEKIKTLRYIVWPK